VVDHAEFANGQFCKGEKMSQVLITGATGLVGGHLLRLLIQDRKVNYIAAPTRRPLAISPASLTRTIRS
jgi:nucleoside-diphosphate-sugar epimerase